MESFYIQELMHFGTMNRYDPVYSYRQDAPRPLSSPKEERAGVRRPRHSSLVTRHAFRFMESFLFLLDLLTGHEPKMHKSLQIKGSLF